MGKTRQSKQRRSRKLVDLDRELLELLERRVAEAAKDAAAGPPPDALDDERYREALVDQFQGELTPDQLSAVLREVQSVSRAVVKPIQVAYLGPEHSYSHIATLQRFGAAAELAPVGAIANVFSEVAHGRVDFGVAPIENSTDGRIVDTLSMLARQPVRISGEIQLRIHHCLLGRCKRGEITEVCSKPQALSQCRDWLATNLPGVKTREVASTALAAQAAARKKGVAAIASRQAGLHNGLDVIVANIEDNPSNITRFAVLGGEIRAATGADKTTLMFQLPHEPGALADAMTIFKRRSLNLTWIESFPMPGKPNEYVFFVEFEGHQTDPDCQAAVKALQKRAEHVDVLGSYPKSQPVD